MFLNQFNTPQLKIGTAYKDFILIGKTKHKNDSRIYYILECQKCHRRRELPRKLILRQSYNGLYHDIGCIYLIKSPYKKRLYSIWSGMIGRTTSPSHIAYNKYKDIKIEYSCFVDFYDDMIDSYIEHFNKYGTKNTTLDRIDVYGNYKHGNLRWATMKTQNDNKKKKVYFCAISPAGKIYVADEQADFAKHHNLNAAKINYCLHNDGHTHKGWKFKLIDKKTYNNEKGL